MFKPVPSDVSFPKLEEEILAFWRERQTFEKSLALRAGSPPSSSPSVAARGANLLFAGEYVFYDGPPFATGLPHYGHLLPGTVKDIIPRYQTMKGRYVPRRFGWDTHGLPVENEIEKKLNLHTKRDIENYGIARFNEECQSIVLRYVREWEKTVERSGRWVDFKNAYRTMELGYMESILWVFRQLWDKGLIYRGFKILPYCPRCATPLSNFETNQGYREVADPAITVRFALQDEDASILAWTTTPWTLPSNMGLAVGEVITYALVEDADGRFILARDRLAAYYKSETQYKVVREFQGAELVGREYVPLFPYFADKKSEGAFRVIAGDFVSTEDGTGIVHIAPGFGEDDARVGLAFGIPAVCPMDDEGRFTSEVVDYAGVFVKDADRAIIQRLKKERKLIKQDQYTHNYPHCWRCDSPLLYRAVSSWFVSIEKIKADMLAANERVVWIPAHLKHGRFGKWLEGARDWAISRNRYWGSPIPVWVCERAECGHSVCVGSIEELERFSGQKVTNLHKHHVDALAWKCPQCGAVMRRTPEVLDCWFESGAMPYAQAHYPFENKERFEATFPADFIAESLDQTRGWFYTLIVLAAALFKDTAFKNVVVTGLVLAEDGQKMSKHLRNYPEVSEILNDFGADALRLYLMNSALVKAEELKFSAGGVKEILRAFHLPLWNSYSFFATYAIVDNWDPERDAIPLSAVTHPLDRWILSAVQRLTMDMDASLEAYDLQRAIPPMLSFLDALTNWYIRRSRRRFWRSASDDASAQGLDDEKKGAYTTLYHVLTRFAQIAAPITPFISEAIWQGLRAGDMPESVHLCDYPGAIAELRAPDLEAEMALAMRTVSMGRALRSQRKIKVRQPLAAIHLVTSDANERAILARLEDILCEELNVKRVIFGEREEELVTLSAKANFKTLGARLGKDMKRAAGLIEKMGSAELAELRARGSFRLTDSDLCIAIGVDDVLVHRSEREGLVVMNEGTLTIALDSTQSEELELEGLARDLVHQIQIIRKESGFAITDRIRVYYAGDERVSAAFERFGAYIKSEVLALDMQLGANSGETYSFDGVDACLAVERADNK
ncbi:MAG: isoleucine--tRNA ligase [Spirochaetota bacterium]|jgi:isoleucyl-tRNA synthetase|nr:isoleucine--tRNA ligase [Spirochaetota bacterium]